jgi:hypothetical protein
VAKLISKSAPVCRRLFYPSSTAGDVPRTESTATNRCGALRISCASSQGSNSQRKAQLIWTGRQQSCPHPGLQGCPTQRVFQWSKAIKDMVPFHI